MPDATAPGGMSQTGRRLATGAAGNRACALGAQRGLPWAKSRVWIGKELAHDGLKPSMYTMLIGELLFVG